MKELIKWYKKAIKAWGAHAQLQMVIEESAELIVALQHYFRRKTNESLMEVLSEIADVEIVLDQAKFILGAPKALNQFKEMKLERLKKRLQSPNLYQQGRNSHD